MEHAKTRASFCLLAVTAVLVLSGCPDRSQTPTQKATVRVQFGWLPDSHHAGFWMAKAKGFYDEERLSVDLTPGGLDSSPLKAVVSGAAEIGQAGGLEQMVSARSEGLPVKALAAFQRTSPYALISLDRTPVRSASDLRGKTVAVAYGDAAEVLFKEFLNRNGVRDNEMTLVPFRFDLTPLMDGRVDVVTGFSTDQPATLKVKGFKPVVLSYADVGLQSYGYTFFCSEQYLAQHRDLVDKFLRASRRGWEYAFAHKEEAISLMRKSFPTLDPLAEDAKFESVRALMCDAHGKLDGWGLDLAIVSQGIVRMQNYGGLKNAVTPESVVAAGCTQP
jgi:NitT/TauT family transport system substrate-binding protein